MEIRPGTWLPQTKAERLDDRAQRPAQRRGHQREQMLHSLLQYDPATQDMWQAPHHQAGHQ
jgi:hypothetical protein